MSLISTVEKSREQRLSDHADIIIYENSVLYQCITNMIRENFNRVWSTEFTPQEIIDTLEAKGISSVQLFGVTKSLQDILQIVSSSYERLIPPNPVTVVDNKIVIQ